MRTCTNYINTKKKAKRLLETSSNQNANATLSGSFKKHTLLFGHFENVMNTNLPKYLDPFKIYILDHASA